MATDTTYVPLPQYVKLQKYEEMSGISKDAFHGKIKRAQLAEGKHFRRAPDGNIYVDWKAMDQWVEGRG